MAAEEATNPSITSSQVAPEHYVLAGGSTPLNAEAAAIWEQALAKASSYLTNLLSDPNREALFADVFGRAGTDAASFAVNLQNLIANLGGDGLQIAVDLRSDGELAGAFAAYAASGHIGSERIYVNADKLNNGLLDVNLATSALLEEFGHALDWRLNGGADSPGDEGQLFAAEVSGVVLAAEQRALIDAEDDTAALMIDGVEVLVELATFTATTGTDNPVLSTGADTVTVEATNQIAAADTFSGGAGTDTIAIGAVGDGVSVDLSAAASNGTAGFLSFEAIQFLNTSGTSTATFAAGQFGSGKIELTSSFTGTASTQGVVINLAAAGTFDASSFSFTTWSSGTDSFTLAGSSGNDTIVGSSQADSISGAAGNDSLSGGDGNDTIDGGTGNDTMTGGAGVDFFITSASGGSSTAATAITGLITGNNIATNTVFTFGNGVDIITDFAVGTDILSGRNTQTLANLRISTSTDLVTNRGYYAYGSWNTSTKDFTFAGAWSSSNNDLIFVVGDSGTLTPVTSTGYTILTDISGSIDTTAPTITSFSTTTANGSYKAGDSINITATASENILAGGQITATLNAGTGGTVILTAATTGSTLTGTYTIAAGQTSADLTVSSFTIGTGAIGTSNATPRDAGFGNALTSTTVPSGTSNIAGSYAIVVDTTAPAALTLSAPADSGSSSSDGITKNSGFSISTPEANATWQYSTNGGNNWTAGSATSFTVANGTYNSGVIQVRQIDQAGNIGPITSSTASITIDTVAPTIAISDNNSDTAKIGQDVTFTFTFSEAVTGFSAAGITVGNGSKGTFTAVSGTTYTLVVTPTVSSAGNITVDVSTTGVTDGAGNQANAPAQYTQPFDTAAPNAPVISTVTDDVASITGTIASGGSTNDTELVLAGTAEANSTVTLYNGSTSLGTTSASGSGAWSFTTATLTDGSTYAFNSTATDAAGNVSSASANYTVTLDTAAPTATVAITAVVSDTGSSSSDYITSDTTLVVNGSNGSLGNGEKVQISTDGSTWADVSVATATTWTYTDPTTRTSNITYQVRVIDTAGNVGNTASQLVTIDTGAPTSSVGSQSVQLVEAGGVANGTTGTAAATITVTKSDALTTTSFDTTHLTSNGWNTADAGVAYTKLGTYGTATFTIASGVVAYALNNSATATQALNANQAASDGFGSIQIVDTAGNTSLSSAISFAITGVNDTPVLAAVTSGSLTDTAANDSFSNITGTLSGTDVDAGTTLTCGISGGIISSDTSTLAGIYGYLSVNTSSGAYTYTPTASAINVLSANATDTFTFSVSDGSLSTTTGFTVNITGVNDTPVLTSAATASFAENGTGTVYTATGSDPESTLLSYSIGGTDAALFNIDSSTGAVTFKSAPNFESPADAVANNVYDITVSASDGTLSSAAQAVAITVTDVDDTPPNAPVISTVSDDVSLVTGVVASGGSTDDTVLVIAGTAEANSTVTLYNGSTSLDTVTADGTGAWTFTTATLSNGSTYAFNATATDAAGNASSASANYTVTVDTAISAGSLSLANYTDSGTSSSDFISTDKSFDLSLSGQEDGATVVYQLSTDGGSNWSTTSTAQSNLSDGAYQFRAVVSDAAGNTANTNSISLTVDTAAPSAPAFSLATDSGASNSDGVTNVGTVNVSGIEDNATWEYSTNSGTNWTTGSGSTFTLAAGSYAIGAIRVQQTDLAGNTTATASQNAAVITVDATAPAVNSFTLSDSALQIGDTATVTLVFSEAVTGFSSDDDITVENGVLSAMTSADDGITWMGTFTPTANIEDATNILRLASAYTDLAGNAGVTASTANYSIDTLSPTTTAAVTAIADNVGIFQGTVASGATTDDSSLSIGGTLSAALATGEIVHIYDGTTYLGNASVSGTTWSYADSRTLINAQSVSYTALVADAAGNRSTAGSAYTATVDTVAPTGSLNPTAPVGSTTADGSYGIGAVINLAVQFSEAVFVNSTAGTPRLQLETGAVDRYAVYTGGSGTNTLSFSYTVQAGDSSADLDQVSSFALELNGGTIRDAAGNNANFSLATPGAVGSLAANAAIVIATAPPNSRLFSTVTQLEWDQDLDSFITGTTHSGANFMLAEVSGTGRPFQGDKDGNLNAKTWEKVRFGDLTGEYLPIFTDSSYCYYYGAVNTGSLGGWGLFLANQNDEFYLLDVDGNCNLSPGINVGSWDSWLPNTYYFATNVVCFLAGTLIATPDGERPIESLKPGDLITTTEGPQPVRFLARSTRSIAQLQALDKMPIRINQAALGCLGPDQDIFMSPSHAIHFAGSLVEAGAMINGTSIQQLNDWPDAALTYYNIELERHGLITANGLLVESYFANYRSNGFSRDCWDNYHDYVALYGAGELMEELPLPRIAFARQIPMQLRLTLQLHEDNYKLTKPAIAASGVDQFAGLCL